MNIVTGTYEKPTADACGYAGWIEPENKAWILFVRADGGAEVYGDRDPVTGGCNAGSPRGSVDAPSQAAA